MIETINKVKTRRKIEEDGLCILTVVAVCIQRIQENNCQYAVQRFEKSLSLGQRMYRIIPHIDLT